MAEHCDANNIGGDTDASKKRILNWTTVLAILGAIVAYLNVAAAAGWIALLAVALGAIAGGILGFAIGSAWDWFSRLKTHNPDKITIQGMVKCAGKNPWGLQPWTDGDWTCNMGDLKLVSPSDLIVTAPGAATQVDEVRTRAAPGSGLGQAFKSYNEGDCNPGNTAACKTDILHCEISSHVGSYSVVGGAVGSVIGAVVGGIVGAALCAAITFFTFGLGAALCVALIALGIAVGAAAGFFVGSLIGSAIGELVDALSDFDRLGKTIEENRNCILFVSGTWVTDTSHQHNEIHDIEAVTIVECDVRSAASGLRLAGAVGIGRHPSDRDP